MPGFFLQLSEFEAHFLEEWRDLVLGAFPDCGVCSDEFALESTGFLDCLFDEFGGNPTALEVFVYGDMVEVCFALSAVDLDDDSARDFAINLFGEDK